MRIKTFQADSMHEALRKVKEELGEDAIILDSRRVRGLLGSKVEVTAAVDDHPKPRAGNFQRHIEEYKRWREQALGERSNSGERRDEIARLREEVVALRRAMTGRREGTEFYGPQGRWCGVLVGRGVERGIAERWLLESDGVDWEAHAQVKGRLKEWLGNVFSLYREDGARVIAFVGPSGMGKTSCLQKLAVRYKLTKEQRVGLVSLDTYRIGAMEQMRSFSIVTGMPLKVAYGPDEAEEAIRSLDEADVILVDTPGGVGGVEEIVRSIGPDEVHLVLAANAKQGDMMEAVRRFGGFPVTHLLFTKLDETISPGTIVNVAYATGKAISYISDGPRIPEDFHQATPELLAGILLDGSPLRDEHP